MGCLLRREDTSTSLPKYIDAANDAQSTGTILEDGAAPGYCDVESPERAIWAATDRGGIPSRQQPGMTPSRL